MIQMLYNFYNFSTKSNKRTKKNCFADEWNPTRTNNPFQFPSTKIQGTQFGLDLEMFLITMQKL